MVKKERNTQEKILTAAREEFVKKSFLNASLRSIVKHAGVTTGAFYKYYDSKEKLFEALVGEPAQHLLDIVDTAMQTFERQSGEEQTASMTDISQTATLEMLDYIYDHAEEFKLILEHAEGTLYADYVHQLVLREVQSTYHYIDTLKGMGYEVELIQVDLVHMLASGMFTGIFETVIHNLPRDTAKEYVTQLRRFYSAGWQELLNVKFTEK